MAHVIKISMLCPLNSRHGLQLATPSGFRGIRLECGCELIADENNRGWTEKMPIPFETADAKPLIFPNAK